MKSTRETKQSDLRQLEKEMVSRLTLDGLKAFLSSPYIKGIGNVYADRIAGRFGFTVLSPEFDFDAVSNTLSGLPEAKIKELKSSLESLRFNPKVAVFLFSAGLGDTEVEKIIGHYGKNALRALLEDPYDMVENAWKVSFFTADKVGKLLGISPFDPRRLRGALLTAVKFYAEKGNMFATEDQAVKTASALTGASNEEIKSQLEVLIREERLVRSKGGIYLPVYYEAEKVAAEKIINLIKANREEDVDFEIPSSDIYGNPLNASQREAIITVMTNPVTVITGGPGTGKTTTIRGIISLFEDMGKTVVLAAPTGRAAKRMSDLAGAESKTIHRLLGYSMGRGYRKKHIEADIIVIDEASMLEQVMFRHLLDALDSDTKIVLVGDTHQLPSIGAGDVLNDIIVSGAVPIIRLKENFRHKSGSRIAAAAEDVRAGRPLRSKDWELRQAHAGFNEEFMVIYEDNILTIHKKLLDLVGVEIPSRFGIDAKLIQVVTPQQDGPLGAKQLNHDIQAAVNPTGPELKRGQKLFRLGDRVMQTANSSLHDVYNGETGWVSAVDEEAFKLEVSFYDGKKQWYDKTRLKELTLAYVTTVHKLQGSETDYMVFILSSAHRLLLYRNLLYTGISRARKLCILLGEEKAIHAALDNESPAIRNSNFKHRLLSGA